jgi:hypothetical protein
MYCIACVSDKIVAHGREHAHLHRKRSHQPNHLLGVLGTLAPGDQGRVEVRRVVLVQDLYKLRKEIKNSSDAAYLFFQTWRRRRMCKHVTLLSSFWHGTENESTGRCHSRARWTCACCTRICGERESRSTRHRWHSQCASALMR